jgi:hypothetical protein
VRERGERPGLTAPVGFQQVFVGSLVQYLLVSSLPHTPHPSPPQAGGSVYGKHGSRVRPRPSGPVPDVDKLWWQMISQGTGLERFLVGTLSCSFVLASMWGFGGRVCCLLTLPVFIRSERFPVHGCPPQPDVDGGVVCRRATVKGQ